MWVVHVLCRVHETVWHRRQEIYWGIRETMWSGCRYLLSNKDSKASIRTQVWDVCKQSWLVSALIAWTLITASRYTQFLVECLSKLLRQLVYITYVMCINNDILWGRYLDRGYMIAIWSYLVLKINSSIKQTFCFYVKMCCFEHIGEKIVFGILHIHINWITLSYYWTFIKQVLKKVITFIQHVLVRVSQHS